MKKQKTNKQKMDLACKEAEAVAQFELAVDVSGHVMIQFDYS